MARRTKVITPRTIVIGVDVAQLGQFDHLPLMWYSECGRYRYIRHCELGFEIDADNKLIFNSDLVLRGGLVAQSSGAYSTAELVRVAPSVIYLERLPKSAQQLKIASAISALKLSKFRTTRTYGTYRANGLMDTSHYPKLSGKVIVKPENGTRGECHVVVDCDLLSPVVIGIAINAFGDKEEMAKLMSTYGGALSFHNGHSNPESRKHDVFAIQEYVPDVVNEYRIITTHDADVGLICHRTRDRTQIVDCDVKSSYMQATGITHDKTQMSVVDATLPDAPVPSFYDEVRAVTKALGCRLGSLDIYITSEGKWGIFEYSNEYGTMGIPAEVSRRFIRTQVEQLAQNALMHTTEQRQ